MKVLITKIALHRQVEAAVIEKMVEHGVDAWHINDRVPGGGFWNSRPHGLAELSRGVFMETTTMIGKL